MSRIFSGIKKFFKGWTEKKIVWTLITSGIGFLGVGLIQQNWARDLAYTVLNEKLNLNFEVGNQSPNYIVMTISLIVGGILIGLGIWFYFKTKENEKKQTMIQVRHSSIESVAFSKFNKDFMDYHVEEHFLDQTEDMKILNEGNLQHALREQEKAVRKLANRLNGSSDIEVSYMGLAHIPLVVLLGYQIADKTNAVFFEWNQNDLEWKEIKKSTKRFPQLYLDKDLSKQLVDHTEEVIIRVGITYPVKDEDLSGLGLDGLNRYYLHLNPPHRNAIFSIEQLNAYQQQFRDLLDEINKTYPNLKRIHLFYSGQPSMAYRLGSSISPRMDKEIWIYNHVSMATPKYKWAINLKKPGETVSIKINGG